MDEARIGQKGRNGHRWWPKGERAPGLADKRFVSTYPYTAARPATDDAFARPPRGQCRHHGIVLLDQAGWHGEKTLAVPVGGAIHGIKSVHIPLLHELSRTHGCNRLITL